MAAATQTERQALTVSEVTWLIKGLLDSEPELRNLWVEGEVSNCKCPPSGHIYFTLKDSGATLRCVMFRSAAARLRFQPKDGLQVIAHGYLSLFERDGQYQLYVQEMEPAVLGGLHLAFEQLKERLAAEGLFDPAKKRRLPALPRRVALVTSPTGAAVRDMIRVAQRRYPNIVLVVVPVLVQGPQAPADIARGLRLAASTEADVVIVGRGGGSIEELWAFNDEQVARAIRDCPLPVISAVGHETDFTIADFAADVRAATPSAAAELVVPERTVLVRRVAELAARVNAAIQQRLHRERQRLQSLCERRVLRDPLAALAAPRQHLDNLTGRLAAAGRALAVKRRAALQLAASRLAAASRGLTTKRRAALQMASGRLAAAGRGLAAERRADLRTAAGRLDALSPLAVLARGYSVCRTPEGSVVRRAAQAPVGGEIEVLLAEESLECRVLSHGRGMERVRAS